MEEDGILDTLALSLRHDNRPAALSIERAGVVYGYCRFSSASQLESSIERQMETIESYAERKGLKVQAFFNDRGVSGTLSERPELHRMLASCKERGGGIVMVEQMDRLSRSMPAFSSIFLQLLEAGVELHVATTGRMDDVSSSMQAIMAANERSRMVARMQSGRRRRALEGAFMCRRPYGYVSDGVGRLKIDPEAAEIVRELYERKAAGESAKALAADLNERGIRGPGRGYWKGGALRRLLSNPIYVGLTVRWDKGDPECR